jgi:hypothetical protein
MVDKNYNTLPDIYKTLPVEEAKNYSKFEIEKSNLPPYSNNLQADSEKYFEDDGLPDKRSNSYETIEKKVENVVQETKGDDMLLSLRTHSYVGHAHEAPKFSRDNEFILSGYRINFHTCETIAKSLCLCHNETMNVWTHLVGALFTVILIIITGVTVGPYGSRINEPWRAEKHKINFEKFSVPFYSSAPIFHNSRIYLTYLNANLKKMSINNITMSNNNINTDDYRTEKFLQSCQEDYSSVYDEINMMEYDIKCTSCIEDFMRNLFTIKDFLEDTMKYLDFINTQDPKFRQSIKDKFISFKDILDKLLTKMNNKVRIFNNYYNNIRLKI